MEVAGAPVVWLKFVSVLSAVKMFFFMARGGLGREPVDVVDCCKKGAAPTV